MSYMHNAGWKVRAWVAPRGAANGNSRLTEDTVREIKREHSAGATRSELARKHRVSFTAIEDIVSGRTWKHVGEVKP